MYEFEDEGIARAFVFLGAIMDRWLDIRRQGYTIVDAIADVLEEYGYQVSPIEKKDPLEEK